MISAVRFIFFVFFVALILVITKLHSAHAEEVRTDCMAVDRLATLTRPSKLIVGVAKDHSKKECRFFVSMPPPNGLSAAFDQWYALKLPAEMVRPNIVGKILKEIATVTAEARAKDIAEIIDKNSAFISNCVAMMLKKAEYENKSPDARMQCQVPKDGSYVEFRVSSNATDSLSVFLPRTI